MIANVRRRSISSLIPNSSSFKKQVIQYTEKNRIVRAPVPPD
jgi:hypothetical protein